MSGEFGTNRSYDLICKIKKFRKTVIDDLGVKGINRYERELVLLIPQESDERTSFLTAWLPEVSGEHYELAGVIAPPIDSPARLSVHRADDRCEKHYLFVMSKGVEEILARMSESALVRLRVLPESEEDVSDFSRDASDGNFQVLE